MERTTRQELQRRFVSFQEELWRSLEAEPPSLLYHYSPPAGIRGILETRELWVSDIQRLNDRREGTYSLDVFRPILGRKSVPASVKNLFGTELYRDGEAWLAYVASFCAAKDLDSQWDDYAAGGTGCAVALALERVSERSNDRKEFAIFKLLYDPGDQRVKVEATIDHAIQLSRELGIPKRDLGDFWLEATIYSLIPCGLRFKDPKFASEQEWRVLAIRADRSTASERTLPDGGNTWYLHFPLDGSLVHSVLLGPRCPYTVDEVQQMLITSGLTGATVAVSTAMK